MPRSEESGVYCFAYVGRLVRSFVRSFGYNTFKLIYVTTYEKQVMSLIQIKYMASMFVVIWVFPSFSK